MEQFSKRFLLIIQILIQKEDFATSNEISRLLNASSKTITRTLKTYGDKQFCLNQGFFIDSKQRYGYKLIVSNRQLVDHFKAIYLKDSIEEISDKSLRIQKIIQTLLLHSNFITIQMLADQLYVSESTIVGDLKQIRIELKKIGLQLRGKTSKGIKIDGNELNIRLGIAKYLTMKTRAFKDDYTLEEIQKIETTVFDILERSGIQLSDLSREHLILHLLISIARMKEDHYIIFDESEKKNIQKNKEYQVSEEIVRTLSKDFSILDKEEEAVYITIQLLGKRSANENNEYTENITAILIEIFAKIERRLGVDLTSDETVFNYLAAHFEPMFTRLKYGMKSNNPLVEEVKIQHRTAFEMGLIAKEIITKKYHYTLDDNEVSYLAMYFSLALDRLKYLNQPKNILIVCGLGICSSRILIYKIRQRYGEYIKDIVTCQFHELKTLTTNQFDCIISTIDKPIGTITPVIYITDFISDLNEKSLDEFFLLIIIFMKIKFFMQIVWIMKKGLLTIY